MMLQVVLELGGQAHSAGGSGQEDDPTGESQYAYVVRCDISIIDNRSVRPYANRSFSAFFINSLVTLIVNRLAFYTKCLKKSKLLPSKKESDVDY